MGTLYLVGTPIGNLEDISLRALRVLKEVDLIAAEDTTRTRKLLSHFDIHTPLVSFHQHSRLSKVDFLLSRLSAGKNIALVSDAGTPGISDPGQALIKKAMDAGFQVVPVPGPSALTAGLSVSGLPTHEFIFIGFLNRKPGARQKQLSEFKNSGRTLIIYESPYRLVATLGDILEVLGNRRIAVARELTKKFEEIWRSRVRDAVAHFGSSQVKGEICLIIGGKERDEE